MFGCLSITNIVCLGQEKQKTVSPVPLLYTNQAVTAIKPYQGGTKPLYFIIRLCMGTKNADTKNMFGGHPPLLIK